AACCFRESHRFDHENQGRLLRDPRTSNLRQLSPGQSRTFRTSPSLTPWERTYRNSATNESSSSTGSAEYRRSQNGPDHRVSAPTFLEMLAWTNCMNLGRFPRGARRRRCRWFDWNAKANISTSNNRAALASTPPRTSLVSVDGRSRNRA